MSLLSEFKEFAVKGNVVDLAVGVVIGGAFGKIVSALVEKLIMPPIGLLVGGVDFTDLKWVLKEAGPDGKGVVAIGYGSFLQAAVDFTIIAFAIFVMIKFLNSLKKPAAPAAVKVPEDIELLREIRDLLKK